MTPTAAIWKEQRSLATYSTYIHAQQKTAMHHLPPLQGSGPQNCCSMPEIIPSTRHVKGNLPIWQCTCPTGEVFGKPVSYGLRRSCSIFCSDIVPSSIHYPVSSSPAFLARSSRVCIFSLPRTPLWSYFQATCPQAPQLLYKVAWQARSEPSPSDAGGESCQLARPHLVPLPLMRQQFSLA